MTVLIERETVLKTSHIQKLTKHKQRETLCSSMLLKTAKCKMWNGDWTLGLVWTIHVKYGLDATLGLDKILGVKYRLDWTIGLEG